MRIVQRFHRRRGETGYILRIDTTGDQYSGFREQATLKMDLNGQIEYLNLMSDATAFLISAPSMVRVDHQAVTPVPGTTVKENRDQLLILAEELRQKRSQRLAVRFLQKYWRAGKGRGMARDLGDVLAAENAAHRAKWHRRMKKVGLVCCLFAAAEIWKLCHMRVSVLLLDPA